MDPITILTAFIPVIQHGIKAAINKFTDGAGVKPATVDDAVKLADIDIRRLEAIARLDEVQGASQWVQNIRGLQRPIAVGIVLLMYVATLSPQVPEDVHTNIANLATAVIFYLFGDRTYLYIKKGSGK
jgi:hypothetical protein